MFDHQVGVDGGAAQKSRADYRPEAGGCVGIPAAYQLLRCRTWSIQIVGRHLPAGRSLLVPHWYVIMEPQKRQGARGGWCNRERRQSWVHIHSPHTRGASAGRLDGHVQINQDGGKGARCSGPIGAVGNGAGAGAAGGPGAAAGGGRREFKVAAASRACCSAPVSMICYDRNDGKRAAGQA